MPELKCLKCACAQCGGHIEFPVEGISSTISCPHCGRETELSIDAPETERAPSRSRKWIIAGVIILVIGVVGIFGALITAKHLMNKAQQRHPSQRVR